jgi:anti-sigma factor RsiW
MTSVPQSPADDPGLLVHAYLDEELDPANSLAVERRIAEDPQLAAERDRILLVRQLIRDNLKREAAPANLRARVETAVGLRRSSSASWRALAASIVLTALVSSAATWSFLTPPSVKTVEDSLVSNHIRSLMATQQVDVASSDQHTVKPWFNGRIPEAPRVVDLASTGFPLIGGRIDVVDLKPVPTLVYHRRQHVISLTAIPGAQPPNQTPVRRTVEGYHLVEWAADGVTYWAVSDVGAADLDDFVNGFRAAK